VPATAVTFRGSAALNGQMPRPAIAFQPNPFTNQNQIYTFPRTLPHWQTLAGLATGGDQSPIGEVPSRLYCVAVFSR